MKFKQQRKTKNMIVTLVQAELQEAILTYMEARGLVANTSDGITFSFQATRGEDGTMATVNIPFTQRTEVLNQAAQLTPITGGIMPAASIPTAPEATATYADPNAAQDPVTPAATQEAPKKIFGNFKKED